jgi:hypothetical protein
MAALFIPLKLVCRLATQKAALVIISFLVKALEMQHGWNVVNEKETYQ